MKKILKEQITQGNCANYQYLYNPNPSPWSWIDNIVAQFGITQNFEIIIHKDLIYQFQIVV